MEIIDWGSRVLIVGLCLTVMFQQRRLAKMQQRLLENDERILGRT